MICWPRQPTLWQSDVYIVRHCLDAEQHHCKHVGLLVDPCQRLLSQDALCGSTAMDASKVIIDIWIDFLQALVSDTHGCGQK